MQTFPKLVSADTIDEIFEIYRALPNAVEAIPGIFQDRHCPSETGHFMMSRFSNDEVSFVWDKIKDVFSEYELELARVLKYSEGCFLQEHVDVVNKDCHVSPSYSLGIQMTDPATYSGGMLYVNGVTPYLEVGDALLWNNSDPHGVKHVGRGTRYTLNLRLKKVK